MAPVLTTHSHPVLQYASPVVLHRKILKGMCCETDCELNQVKNNSKNNPKSSHFDVTLWGLEESF